MIAVLGGLGAAVIWATGSLCVSRCARLIGSAYTLAWVMLVGLALTLPLVLIEGRPDGLDRASLGWLTVSGVGNVVGLLFLYGAFRSGKVSLVAPITSVEGSFAAMFAFLGGERRSGEE